MRTSHQLPQNIQPPNPKAKTKAADTRRKDTTVLIALLFEEELGIKTRKAEMAEEIQYWFKYEGEVVKRRWVFKAYDAEVVLRVESRQRERRSG